jgi:integral membrane protein
VKPVVLTRYRVMAWITGCMLLVLCLCMVLKYGFDTGEKATLYVSQAHGLLYMIYLVVTFDLSSKLKWKFERMLLMMLAGTIPLASFFAERKAVAMVQERELAATSA